MLEVIQMHRDSLRPIHEEYVQASLLCAARESWDRALETGEKFGYRNSQVSVLAPTGTIGFMMDCDTTGIEPDLALVKHKRLVGGGVIKLVNNTVPQALMGIGYSAEKVARIVDFVDRNGIIEGAPDLDPKHVPIFDCSLATVGGGRSIAWRGHLQMMAAAQPFLSGAISKTINMPEESTVEDIMEAYIESWKFGLKAVAIYRDNSKRSQPLSATGVKKEEAAQGAVAGAALVSPVTTVTTPMAVAAAPAAQESVPGPEQQELFVNSQRKRLPVERHSITHKFSVGGQEGYITVGMYDDNRPGEVFIKMAREGSTLSGIMDGLAVSISIALQYGVPLKALVDKLMNTRFDPAGITQNPQIRLTSSVLDYIARWLGGKFISSDYLKLNGGHGAAGTSAAPAVAAAPAMAPVMAPAPVVRPAENEPRLTPTVEDAPYCSECGMPMVPNGSCFKCENCGSTSGCS
jgi:ribonucleoside-diphosphate reductase alpha chain